MLCAGWGKGGREAKCLASGGLLTPVISMGWQNGTGVILGHVT